MENKIKEKKDMSLYMKIFIQISITVISSLLISIFVMIVYIRDSVNYIIPYKNQQQDTAIHILHINDIKIYKKIDKTNTKIDSVAKSNLSIDGKLDKIIRNQETFNKRQIFIFKTVKDLKPYSGLLTTENKTKDTLKIIKKDKL